MPALLAVVIGEETEASRVHAFEQNDPHGWLAVRCRGGEAHRVDVADIGGQRGGEPGAELLDGIGMKIGTTKPMRIVFVAQRAQVGNRRLIHNGKRGTLFETGEKVEARFFASSAD